MEIVEMEKRRKRAERSDPVLRKEMILCSALIVSNRIGYNKITFKMVAEHAGVTKTSVIHYFKSLKKLQSAILKAAIEKRMNKIIAHGLLMREPIILRAPKSIRQKAVESLLV